MDTDILKKLFREYTGKEVTEMIALPPSGSHRRYFRLRNDTFTAIGAIIMTLQKTGLSLNLPVIFSGKDFMCRNCTPQIRMVTIIF